MRFIYTVLIKLNIKIMQHIKNYNEKKSVGDSILSSSIFPIEKMDMLNSEDFKKLNKMGKEVYFVNKDYKLEKIKRFWEVKTKTAYYNKSTFDTPDVFKYFLFLKGEQLDDVQELLDKLSEVEKIYNKKMKTMFEYVKVLARKGGGINETS